jgi:hypothetical protein
MGVGPRLLAAGLMAVLLTPFPAVRLAPRGETAAAPPINPSTWAPSAAGAYFFDRSDLAGGSPAGFARRESEFGRKFDGHLYYVPAQVTSADLADAHWSLATDRVPFVILSWATGNNPNTIIPDIAAGKYDQDIAGFARAVKAELSPYGRILIRPFWEFNYTGSEWNDVHYGGDAHTFVSAWRRFVGIFRQNRVGNVKWLWNPIRVGSQAQNPVPYYPGAGYVDWIGLDAYPKNTWLTLAGLATTSGGGSSFDWYDTFKNYGKPLMFGEVGILPANLYGGGAPTRATWWRDALTELKSRLPAVRAVEYFDASAAYDWRYDTAGTVPGDSGSQALAAARRFASSCYMDVVSGACRARPPHRTVRPSPSASSQPPVSPKATHRALRPVPQASGWPLWGTVVIIGGILVAIGGALWAYRRFRAR